MTGSHQKVLWSEGMFLRPVHFQQQVRYLENLVEGRCGPMAGHGWGFAHLRLDGQLLGLGKLAIAEAKGVFPDGTPFNIPDEDEPPLPIDIDGSLRGALICLGLPARRAGALEVSTALSGESPSRYVMHEKEVLDTHTPDSGGFPMQLGRLNLKLVADRDRHSELLSVGLARILEVREDKRISLDESYIPPLLDTRASATLLGFVKELQGLAYHRAEALAGRITEAGRGGMSELADFLMLQVLNRFGPLLGHLVNGGLSHPREVYAWVLSLAGELSTFTHPRKRPPDFPVYLHEDLCASFAPVMAELRRSLSMVLEQNAVRIPLEDRKYGVRVGAISDRKLLEDSSFVLAVKANLPSEELRRHLPAQLKIGSVEQIRQLVNLQLPGIQVRPLAVAPRQIPFLSGYVYFELDRASEHWASLKTSGGFALHVGGEFPGLEMEFWAIRGA
jgi:type VI secretion system protein ImpJ